MSLDVLGEQSDSSSRLRIASLAFTPHAFRQFVARLVAAQQTRSRRRPATPTELLVTASLGCAKLMRMGEIAFTRRETEHAWSFLETTVSDVTPQQAKWLPAGTANSIGATYIHVVINTDVELLGMVHNLTPVIELEPRLQSGLGYPYNATEFDRWVPGVQVEWEILHEYGRLVHAALLASLETLTDADLDRPIDMTRSGLGMWQGRDIYQLHGWSHVYMHGGEIACLKGLQGAKGYVGGVDALPPRR